MRIDDPALIDLLAQRFVTGIQRGAARRRFETLLHEREDVRRAVGWWEARLTPLAWGLTPVQPSELVWQRICRELALGTATPAESRPPGGRLWAAAAAGFAAIAIVAATGWWRAANQPPETVTRTVIERVPEEVGIALIEDSGGRALWLTRIAPDSRELTARVVNDVARHPDKDYELWALTAAGTPVSLGLLPQSGRRTVKLDDAAVAALASASTVAVSLEPAGGSPAASPTGPVLYTAPLLAP